MTRNTLLAAIDCGKSDTKICVLDKGITGETLRRDSFPTAMGVGTNGGTDLLTGVHTFSSNATGIGMEYTIGSGELPIKADDSFSKNSKVNKVCTLYGIARNVSDGDTINVVIGCPLTIFMNVEERDEYCKSIVPKGLIACVVDGKRISFTIDKRLVCAEAIGYKDRHPECFRPGMDAAIIDIGGLNMNMTSVHDGIVVIEDAHTNKLGGRRLIADVQKRLQDHEIEVSDQQVIDAIRRGYVKQHDEEKQKYSKAVIDDAVRIFVDDIESALKKNWKNYDTLELHFTGGTSYLIREELESRFGKFANFEKSYEDARFANAEGFVKHLAGKIARDAASR